MIDTFAIRCNVLKLAFSGQLSQHEIEDGTIDDLLKRVDPNREIKQEKVGPHEIPKHWAWVKLADLYEINPKVEVVDDADAAFIPMERISAGFSESFSFEVQKWSVASKNHTRFADGDVAFAKISPCFENRKSLIVKGLPNGIGGGTTELIILRQKEMLPKFTYYVTLDQRFIRAGVASYKGTVGQQRVKSDVIKNYMVAVPPKEEQRRIIEKIEDIFSVLDTIDTLQSQYQDNLAVLKSKIIDAGIQGQLTEQLPEDGTAEELHQQIQQEKLALEKAGKIKKSKPLPPISDDEILFDAPDTWKWVRLGDIIQFLTSGSRDWAKYYSSSGDVFLRMGNLSRSSFRLRLDNIQHVNLPEDAEGKRTSLQSGDLLFSITGEIGMLGLIPDDFGKAYINQHTAMIRFVDIQRNKYVPYLLLSYYAKEYFEGNQHGIKNSFNLDSISNMPIPLPPLAEQKRIVAKLEELLPLCEG